MPTWLIEDLNFGQIIINKNSGEEFSQKLRFLDRRAVIGKVKDTSWVLKSAPVNGGSPPFIPFLNSDFVGRGVGADFAKSFCRNYGQRIVASVFDGR